MRTDSGADDFWLGHHQYDGAIIRNRLSQTRCACEAAGQTFRYRSTVPIHIGIHMKLNDFKLQWCYEHIDIKASLEWKYWILSNASVPKNSTCCWACTLAIFDYVIIGYIVSTRLSAHAQQQLELLGTDAYVRAGQNHWDSDWVK